ncbi:MAG: sugar transferase [Phycisphaerales bacterium]
MHDALWRSRGVEVVRPGQRRRVGSGAGCWLLVPGVHDLIEFGMNGAGWRAPKLADGACVMRVMPSCRTTYRERLDRDSRGVRGIRRQYAAGNAVAWGVLTTDRAMAKRWGAGLDSDASAISGLNGHGARTIEQAVRFDGLDGADAAAWLGAEVAAGADLGAVAPGAYRLSSSTWSGEDSRVPERVQLAGPVCIGAGAEVPEGAVLIGPVVVPDGWRAGLNGPPITGDGVEPREAKYVPASEHAYRVSKRAFDVVFAALTMLVGVPFFVGIALAILIEDGRPVIFRQRRQTVGGREFDCLKFRTMVRNADELQAQLRAQNKNEVGGPQFSMANDPRILRVGRWLRRTQLDEMPQFWNVLKGEMSIVGPRPSPDRENQYCPAWREARLSVPAGITGLWQVRRRRDPDTDFQEWIRYDIEYAHRRCWRLDLRIMLETAMLFAPGAAGKRRK